MIKQNMKYLNRLFVIADAILVAFSLFVAWYIRIYSGWIPIEGATLPFNEYMMPLFFLIPGYLILYNIFNLYRPHRTKSLYDEMFSLLKANSFGAMLFFAYLFTFKMVHYSRVVIGIFFLVSIIVAILERLIIRYILRRFRRSNKNLRHIVFVGYSDLAVEYSRRITMNQHWGYRIQGIFDEKEQKKYLHLYKGSYKNLGDFTQLEAYILKNDLDEVIITLPLDQYSQLEQVADICERHGVYSKLIPDYYRIVPARPYIEDIDGLSVISLRNVPLNDLMKRMFKRSFDLVVSVGGIILLSPMFLFISMLIKMTSNGPLLYSQKRVGMNRREFLMYKFRSMCVIDECVEKKHWTVENDPRVTKIGKFIRKTSIDEFPQLINVIKGEMSLIGPRPERPQFVERYRDEIPKYMIKHQVRPGMTGWAQIHGLRGDTSIKKRIEHDIYYIENWSIKLEIKIFFMTFVKGFVNKNAY